MNLEDVIVSGAPAEIYTPAGSLLEYHAQVMNTDGAANAGVRFIFNIYDGAYYRHTATSDMMVDADHLWSAELLERHK